jgi:hypothetical protein
MVERISVINNIFFWKMSLVYIQFNHKILHIMHKRNYNIVRVIVVLY